MKIEDPSILYYTLMIMMKDLLDDMKS